MEKRPVSLLRIIDEKENLIHIKKNNVNYAEAGDYVVYRKSRPDFLRLGRVIGTVTTDDSYLPYYSVIGEAVSYLYKSQLPEDEQENTETEEGENEE